MAELNFPFPASVDQLYTGTNSVTYIYDGVKWKVRSLAASAGGAGTLTVSNIDEFGYITNPISDAVALRFDTSSGFLVSTLPGKQAKISLDPSILNVRSFSSIEVPGQTTLTALGSDALKLKGGIGIQITTDDTDDPKSITITATGGAGGSSTNPIKTFNILNEFSAPLIGTAIFVPVTLDTIRSVQLTNGKRTGSDIMVGLYRNNELLQFFTLPAGNISYSYTSLNYIINTNDYLTVNVVAGNGINFSMALYNI